MLIDYKKFRMNAILFKLQSIAYLNFNVFNYVIK